MWHRVEVVLTDVSEERIASIFRVEGKIRKSAREASVRDVNIYSRIIIQCKFIYFTFLTFDNFNLSYGIIII
jgi:hypothetical protein